MVPGKPRRFQPVVSEFPGNTRQGVDAPAIRRPFDHALEKNRLQRKNPADPTFDRGQASQAEIGVRVSEVEEEFDSQAHGYSPKGEIGKSRGLAEAEDLA